MESRRPMGAGYFLLDLAQMYFSKHVGRSAAALTYFLSLTFFPALLCVSAIVGSFHLDAANLLEQASALIPQDAMAVLRDYVEYVSANRSSGLLTVGLVTMIWFASSAMQTLMSAITEIYGRAAYRGLWSVVASVAFSVLFLVTVYLSLAVILSGNWLFRLLEDRIRLLPQMEHFTMPWRWQWMKYVLLFALLLLFMLLLYRAVTPRSGKQTSSLLGALLAAVALVVSSMLFSHFIGISSRYSLVYGSVASVVILMLWLCLCGNIVILGACFNRVWESRRGREKSF